MRSPVSEIVRDIVLEYNPRLQPGWISDHVEIRKNKGSAVWHLKIDGERVAMVSFTPGGSEPEVVRYDGKRKEDRMEDTNEGIAVRANRVADESIRPDGGLDRRFTYHPPRGHQADRYLTIRKTAKGFAELIEGLCPASRERSLAFTNLEQAVMWANASISRNE